MPNRPRTSTRDQADLIRKFTEWLAVELRADDAPRLSDLRGPGAAGFSSETVIFDLAWTVGGRRQTGSYVLRLPPSPEAYPLFPRYEMDRQVAALRFVRDRSSVPVPAVPWFEPKGELLGAPFFVMEEVAGVAVPDMPPYVFGSWVTAATEAEKKKVSRGAVGLLVGIHGIPAELDELDQWALDAPGATPLARHVANQRRYYDWIRGASTFSLIDATFEWLEDHWPESESKPVLSWGDARLANILWRDFEPTAVLDWEAVAIGPRELDLGWMVFFHEYFQRIAERYGYEGVPGLLDRTLAVADYAERAGYEPQDLEWYLVYAELRQALTSIRVSSRAIHFGERDAPDDHQDLILERDHLEAVIDGAVPI